MKTFKHSLKQAGISLLEVLLSLAIISIILVMAVQYFTTASNNQKLNMIRTFIGADMAALQGFGINNSGFTTDGTASVTWTDLVNDGYLSKDTKSLVCGDGGCQQKTPWGDNVNLVVAGSMVSLTFDVPDGSFCTNLQQSYGVNTVNCGGSAGTGVTVYVNGYTAG